MAQKMVDRQTEIGTKCPVCHKVYKGNLARHIGTAHRSDAVDRYLERSIDESQSSEYRECLYCHKLLHKKSLNKHVKRIHKEEHQDSTIDWNKLDTTNTTAIARPPIVGSPNVSSTPAHQSILFETAPQESESRATAQDIRPIVKMKSSESAETKPHTGANSKVRKEYYRVEGRDSVHRDWLL